MDVSLSNLETRNKTEVVTPLRTWKSEMEGLTVDAGNTKVMSSRAIDGWSGRELRKISMHSVFAGKEL